MKYLLCLATLLVAFGCAKEKTADTITTTAAETTTTAAETQPPPVQPQNPITLPAGAPIPANGVLLWLAADDAVAKDGKFQSWQNVKAVHDDQLPAIVPNAINGHAVVHFDGTDQQLMTSTSIAPAQMPEGTVITVFRSTTADASPLRKVYGDDNGGYDRAVGLDDRAPGKNFTVFTGNGVEGYFQLAANTTYILVDEYASNEFSGWVNGAPALTKVAAAWGGNPDDALPNLYLGGTGVNYAEYWNGDLAEILVYARKLSEAERAQTVDYLAKKYGVAIAPPK